jgi:HlyD family secretion protein
MPSIPRRLWIPALLIIAFFLFAHLWGFTRFLSTQNEAETGNTTTVRRGTLAAFVTATGKLNADRKARLAFPVAGTVLSIAEVGTELAANSAVATLQNPELQLRYDEAQAGLTVAIAQRDQGVAGATQGEIDVAQAQLEASQLALSVAQARLDGIAPENQATSTELVEVERARAAVLAAEATLRQAVDGVGTEELIALEAQVQQAQIRLQLAEVALQSATLTVPFAGVVTERMSAVGERVSGGQQVVTVSDLSTLYLAADVDEVDVGRVTVGQLVTVTIDAFPTQPLTGTVTVLGAAAVPQRGTTVYLAKIALAPTPLMLRLDMSAEAQIRTADENEVLLLPQTAIRYAENQPYVLVRRNGQNEQQSVTLGAADDRDVAILAGLSEGEVVVLP